MAPKKNDGEVHERWQCNATSNDSAAIDCLTDTSLGGVAAEDAHFGGRIIFLGFVE
jgi:hypothetical protein